MSYGFFTCNKEGERTSWTENYTFQLYDEMQLTQVGLSVTPDLSYRIFNNYDTNGTFKNAGTVFLATKDHTAVFEYPDLNHIEKENIVVQVFHAGCYYNTVSGTWDAAPTKYCPAWSYRILKAGDKIALTGDASSVIVTTTCIAIDCSSEALGAGRKLLKVKIYVKGEV